MTQFQFTTTQSMTPLRDLISKRKQNHPQLSPSNHHVSTRFNTLQTAAVERTFRAQLRRSPFNFELLRNLKPLLSLLGWMKSQEGGKVKC